MSEIDRLRQFLRYDPVTGKFFWKVRRPGRARSSGEAGWIRKGYRCISLGQKDYTATHVAWALMTGEWPADEIDHRNRNSLDDRWINLRPATRLQNEANKQAANRNSRTGYRGVREIRGRFEASIMRNRARVVLGYFATAEEAHAAYQAASLRMDGEFAAAA